MSALFPESGASWWHFATARNKSFLTKVPPAAQSRHPRAAFPKDFKAGLPEEETGQSHLPPPCLVCCLAIYGATLPLSYLPAPSVKG